MVFFLKLEMKNVKEKINRDHARLNKDSFYSNDFQKDRNLKHAMYM